MALLYKFYKRYVNRFSIYLLKKSKKQRSSKFRWTFESLINNFFSFFEQLYHLKFPIILFIKFKKNICICVCFQKFTIVYLVPKWMFSEHHSELSIRNIMNLVIIYIIIISQEPTVGVNTSKISQITYNVHFQFLIHNKIHNNCFIVLLLSDFWFQFSFYNSYLLPTDTVTDYWPRPSKFGENKKKYKQTIHLIVQLT